MHRLLLIFLLLGALSVSAQEDPSLVTIISPDTAVTFAFGTIKSRTLLWDEKTQTLIAQITFEDTQTDGGRNVEDTHRFRIPGIRLDKARGIFYAATAAGAPVPVAQRKRVFFSSSIEVTTNALVRISHERGEVSVTLQAIPPSEVAEMGKRVQEKPQDTRSVDLKNLLQ